MVQVRFFGKLREEFKAKGLITNPDDNSKYSCFSANIKTESLSNEQIEFLIWKMYQSWFSEKSWFFWNNIRYHYPLHLMKLIFKLFIDFMVNWSFKIESNIKGN